MLPETLPFALPAIVLETWVQARPARLGTRCQAAQGGYGDTTMNATTRFCDAFTLRAWGPDAPGQDVTVTFYHRNVSPSFSPDVAAPGTSHDSVAEAKVCLRD